MTRNIIDFDSFSPSEDYNRNEELSIEEALDMLDEAELLEELLAESEGDPSVLPLSSVGGELADKIKQGLQKAGVEAAKGAMKAKPMAPKDFFGKVTNSILKSVADPTQAALILRNVYSRFLNQNKVPCNMINIKTRKEVKYADYAREMQAKAQAMTKAASKGAMKAPGAKPGPAPKPGSAPKPEGK